MRFFVLTLVAVAATACGQSAPLDIQRHAQGQPTFGSPEAAAIALLESTANWFEANVAGKTLKWNGTTTLDNGNVEADSDITLVFNGFTRSARGFSYNVINMSERVQYDVVGGQRQLPGVATESASTRTYEFSHQRAYPSILFGLSQTTGTSSGPGDTLGRHSNFIARFDGTQFTLEVRDSYTDCTAAGGGVFACATPGQHVFRIVDGALEHEQAGTFIEVDPETLEPVVNGRTPEQRTWIFRE